MFAKVAHNIPFCDPFDYAIPAHLQNQVLVGQRVIVPLREKFVVGYIIEIHNSSSFAQVKDMCVVVDKEPILTDTMLNFGIWVAHYYMSSVGEVLAAFFPNALKPNFSPRLEKIKDTTPYEAHIDSLLTSINEKTHAQLTKNEKKLLKESIQKKYLQWIIDIFPNIAEKQHSITYYSINTENKINIDTLRGKKQAAIIEFLKNKQMCNDKDFANKFHQYKTSLRELIKKGIVYSVKKKKDFSKIFPSINEIKFPTLTEEQNTVYHKLVDFFVKKYFQVFLLHGLTGSGKTEVYAYCIRYMLLEKKSVLMLVPEIAITFQTIRKLQEYFPERVFVLHSGLTNNEKFVQWQSIKKNNNCIVIGTRSAIFSPIKNIGLIIVDEEHDNSYKQMENPFYNGRDCAIKLASLKNIPVLLGSATPSLESYYNCKNKKYFLLQLTKRYHQDALPQFILLNMKQSKKYDSYFYLSQEVKNAIDNVLSQNKQILVYLNRRGYAPILYCKQCLEIEQCKNCSLPLTWHDHTKRMECHHCGFIREKTLLCSKCQSKELRLQGLGIERIEEDFSNIFPQANIQRMDRDCLNNTVKMKEALQKIADGEANIIIGTQLITKGHDFPNIALVCVLLADMSLNIPHYRSTEKTYQTITQISGRAGRNTEHKGVTYLQTSMSNHPIYQYIYTHSYDNFYQYEIEKRKLLGYPPILRYFLVQMSSVFEEKSRESAFQLHRYFLQEKHPDIYIDGPITAPIYKQNNRFYWQIILRCVKWKLLHNFCYQKLWNVRLPINTAVRLTVIVDF